MNRRTLLRTTSSVFLTQGMMGCSLFPSKSAFKLQILQASLPPQVTRSFQRTHNTDLTLALSPTPDDLFGQLQTWVNPSNTSEWWRWLPWNRPSEIAQLMALGDSWLSSAISQNLLRPFTTAPLQHWRSLPSPWQQVGQRDRTGFYSPQGDIWGIPYRWGVTAIAYNRDKLKPLGWQPTDWSDLWRSDIQGRISLLDQPREVVGLVLKLLGHSYNARSPKTIPQLLEKLRLLNRQAAFYSSSSYLQPLMAGDTWLAVGWSSDIIMAMQQHPEIELVIPQSGTALWADLWVQPRTAATSDFINPWLDFCLDPDVMQQIARASRGGTWIKTDPLNPLKGASALWLDPTVLNRSEFMQPLSESLAQDYQDLWQTIRTA